MGTSATVAGSYVFGTAALAALGAGALGLSALTALLLAAMCAIGARELLWATGLVLHKRLVAYAMLC